MSVEELVMAMADDERFGAQLFREQVGLAGSCGVDVPGRVHAQHSCSASRMHAGSG